VDFVVDELGVDVELLDGVLAGVGEVLAGAEVVEAVEPAGASFFSPPVVALFSPSVFFSPSDGGFILLE
jgi:hypothetical protein